MERFVGGERDNFPWVVGALVAATTALAAAIALINPAVHSTPMASLSTAPGASLVPAAETAGHREATIPAQALPKAVDSPSMAPAPHDEAPRPTQTATPERATPVWECAGNGQRIFSDAPCGSGGVAMRISPPNRMEATPVLRAYPAASTEPNVTADAPAWPADYGATGDSYAMLGGVYAVRGGTYAVRGPEQYPRHHGPEPAPGHSPMAPRRSGP
jgi:hypothetical protein